MTAYVQDAAIFVNTRHALLHLVFQGHHAFVERDGRQFLARLEQVLDFLEYPRPSEGGTSHQDAIDARFLEALLGNLCRCDIAVADDGNVDARILLHLADQRPVGFSGVHLRTRAPMDGQCLDAAVLQLLSQCGDDLVLAVPAQTRLHGHRQMHGIDHGSCDFEHQWDVTQHSCTGTLARHALHGAAEIDVDDVRSCLFHNLCSLDHRRHIAPVDLDHHGALLFQHAQLLHRLVDAAYQGIGRHEFRIDHVSTEVTALQAKTHVGHILHRRQHHSPVGQRYISNLHILIRG